MFDYYANMMMADLCHMVYEDVLPDKIYTIRVGIAVHKISDCSLGTARAVVFKNPSQNLLYVVSRGTQANLSDWLHDLDATLTKWQPRPEYEAVEVHDGFLNDMMLVKELLDNVVLPHIQAGGRVALGGHSKGAAECVLYGLTLPPEAIASVYTYGMPKPGGKAFATLAERHLGDKFHRVVNDTDIVCHVPGGNDFCHFGMNVLQFDQSGTPFLRTNNDDPTSINIVRDVKDHRMVLYLARSMAAAP